MYDATVVDAVDVVILTVIPPELAAVRRVFGLGNPLKASDGTTYYRGTIASRAAHRDYSIAVVCVGQAGNPPSAAATTAAIAMFRCKAVFLSGHRRRYSRQDEDRRGSILRSHRRL